MTGLALKRNPRRRTLVSIVSLIDVMMILLFFFMITSSYLNLDMVPALQKADGPPPAGTPAAQPAPAATLFIRIGANGTATVAGQPLDSAGLTRLLHDRLARDALLPVVLFPSGGARLQALITVMDTVTRAGAVRVRVIRLEAAP